MKDGIWILSHDGTVFGKFSVFEVYEDTTFEWDHLVTWKLLGVREDRKFLLRSFDNEHEALQQLEVIRDEIISGTTELDL